METPEGTAQARPDPLRRWRFGSADFDERVWELRLEGQIVEVERKPLEVLRFLLRNPDRLVTKEEILEAVWPRRILSESVLTKCVARLREALGDERQEIIRTVYGQGYRLTAQVTAEVIAVQEKGRGGSAVTPARWTQRWVLVAGAGTALMLAVVLLAPWADRQGSTLSRVADDKSVAVLPFENLSAEPDSRYFTDGLHGSVITHLAHVQDLRVIAQTSVLPYRQRSRDLRTVAHELDVAHVVEGNVQRVGNRLRVSARLIRVADIANVWAAEYDRAVSDVFEIQADIARQIALAVDAQLRRPEEETIDRIPTRSPPAYELYLKAQEAYREPRFDRTFMKRAIENLEQAVRLDPQFAQAHALLAIMHDVVFWAGLDPSAERRARVREAADTALRLNPELVDALIARAVSLYHGSRDYDGAIKFLETARRLAPGDARVHFWAGVIYRRQGRWKESVAALERAALLDPRNRIVLMELAGMLRNLRRYAEAEDVQQRLVEVAPDDPLIRVLGTSNDLGWRGDLKPLKRVLEEVPSAPDTGCQISWHRHMHLMMKRQYRDAATAILACEEDYVSAAPERYPKVLDAAVAFWLAGDHEVARRYAGQARVQMKAALQEDPDRPLTRMLLAYAHIILGDHDAARDDVKAALEAMPVSRDALVGNNLIIEAAQIYALLGDTEPALDRLELALSLPGDWSPNRVRLWPVFDSLREHPRFRELTSPSAVARF